ncbi:hypothetical protein BN7_4984 [Wickerhamomyces ciferrii]|uniref:Cytidyltransferase-like domain-containing protein n=1 Tax=Wickerhamomyces ciferrii (strain ATCC 14091 / BCRC 22168 / CBS 111 / JCM 3599 / NBRC 0793 / NRRL Y-1031 F-60-10) TaxID=1206466 RepID=K0KTQ2_WICCF|nr:uncharacterized protein BN7_4984 [Wickerhamomyces ciferrii]CCH45402.1 hypothetical protein BN7_4984 [Wickerhamomyces ciferrii]
MSIEVPPLRFLKQLQNFKNLKKGFEVVYSNHGEKPLNQNISRLCILDSSFNPPTKGHLTLVSKTIDYYTQDQKTSIDDIHVVLLLAINNADKLPKPAQFESRLDMMALFADHIQQKFEVPVTVALTEYPKFIDKAKALETWVDSWVPDMSKVRFAFLVGFDTLIRIFNPKYYTALPISQALNEFIQRNDTFCLTRSDEANESITDQFKYVQDIADGKTDLPTSWADKIHLMENDPDALAISSSEVRDGVEKADDDWKTHVTDEVARYIINEKVY